MYQFLEEGRLVNLTRVTTLKQFAWARFRRVMAEQGLDIKNQEDIEKYMLDWVDWNEEVNEEKVTMLDMVDYVCHHLCRSNIHFLEDKKSITTEELDVICDHMKEWLTGKLNN